MALVAMSFIACEEKPLDPTSQIIDSKLEQNEFDKWLVTNYIEPYNIMFSIISVSTRFLSQPREINNNFINLITSFNRISYRKFSPHG